MKNDNALWSIPLSRDTVDVATAFDPVRAIATATRIWEQARRMDADAVRRTAECVAGELRAAGLREVRVERLPADGESAPGGWIMPLEWTLESARLEVDGEVLADANEIPQSIAEFSPATPGGDWIEGPVAVAGDVAEAGERVRGAFLLLDRIPATPDAVVRAAEAGAVGVVIAAPNPDPNAVRYLNYVVPFDAHCPSIPCFSLSPARAWMLRRRLVGNPALRLRACVKAQRRPGKQPLVHAVVGEGAPAIYVCAHLDEPGAQDNASGVAAAVEAFRILHAATQGGSGRAPVRSVHALFGVEIRGVQAWMNRPGAPEFFAGLNLDMVGLTQRDGKQRIQLGTGFSGALHVAGPVLVAAARLADRCAGRALWTCRPRGLGDAAAGGCACGGHVAIEQMPDDAYHTSRDTPDRLDVRMMRWSGIAATAFLHALSRLDDSTGLAWGRSLVRRGERESQRLPPREAFQTRAKAGEGIASIVRALSRRGLFGAWSDAESLYRAGVDPRTGLWPDVAARLKLEALAEAHPPHRPSSLRQGLQAHWMEADRLVPLAGFRGFLAFEDEQVSGGVAELAAVIPGSGVWGGESWAWRLAMRFRGKATLGGVLDALRGEGVQIDVSKALGLVRHLVASGKVRLRPFLDSAALRSAFLQIGVRRGSVLCVQASLSQFGYIAGGAASLVDALLDVLGPEGTLCIPTHSESLLGGPPFERETSPSKLGAVSRHFLSRRGVRRSSHPTHSVAAFGPAAEAFVESIAPDSTPMSRDGFWGRLVDADGDMLLLCPVTSATIFHVGEAWTGLPQPPIIAHERVNGRRRRVVVVPGGPWHVDHFARRLAAPLLADGRMRRAELGDSTIFLACTRDMAEISVAVNCADPLASLGRGGACRCFYCNALREGVARR